MVRPLWHEFPRDPATRAIDTQFLWGQTLLVSPVLEQVRLAVNFKKTVVTYVVPTGSV